MMTEAAVPVKRLLIVFHSLTGATRQLAAAIREGAAAEPAVAVSLCEAAVTGPAELEAADGYVFACPETLASMSGQMKDFFDRCYYPALGRLEGRPYALAVCAGSDGQGAIRQLERIVTGWRLRAIAPPLLVITRAQTAEAILAPKTLPPQERQRAADLGAAFATGLAAGIF